jgi:hypothetical protein
MGGVSEPHKPVHEPTTDCRFGEDETGDGAVLSPPRHRFGLDDGGRLTRKNGAPGIDGVTAADMPEPRLRPLIDRFIEYISQNIALAPLLSFE